MLTKNLPKEFDLFFDYCRGLSFEDRIDIEWLRQLFKNLFEKSGFVQNYIFDWMIS